MGAEDSSRFFQGAPNLHCLRVRATEHAPRVRQRVLERTRGLAEIVVERFVGAERRSRMVHLASFVTISCVTPNAPRRGVGQWRGAGGASCEDHGWSGGRLGAFSRGVIEFCLLLVSYKTLADYLDALNSAPKSLQTMGFCN